MEAGSAATAATTQPLTNITVQATDWKGDVALPGGPRVNAPVTFGLPIPDADGVSGAIGTAPPQLELQDSTGKVLNAQFRVLGHWNSGNAKWVLIDAQLPSYTEGSSNTTLNLVQVGSGGGNNPATAMGTQCTGSSTPIAACPDANHIVVQTGVATFLIKEASYNLFDSVKVGSTTLVSATSHGADDGLVLMGPRAGLSLPDSVSCPNGPPPYTDATAQACDNAYLSANDSASTCSFDDNGPLRTTVRCSGDLKDSAGDVYMHWTTRTTFWANHSDVKVESILHNDEPTLTNQNFASAFKEFASFAAEVTMNLASGSRTVTFGTASGTSAQTLSNSADSAYLYQGYEDWEEWSDFTSTFPCTTAGAAEGTQCAYSPIMVTDSSGTKTYGQNGYQVVLNGIVQTSGTNTQVVPGWADEVDSSSNGVEIGVFNFGGVWPKSLEFSSQGSQVRIGIWPDQAEFLPNPTDLMDYAEQWPGETITNLYFDFHVGALSNQAEPYAEADHNLIGRASTVAYYNAAKDATTGLEALQFDMPDPVKEDTYLANLGVVCTTSDEGSCLTDAGIGSSVNPQMKSFRYYYPSAAGMGNEHDFAWSYMRNWLERGLVGRYVLAGNWEKFQAETLVPHADGGECVGTLCGGFRALCTSGPCANMFPFGYPENTSLNATGKDWMDRTNSQQHAHIYGEIDWYYLTGDETYKDHFMSAFKDMLLNPYIGYNNPAYSADPGHNANGATRSLGQIFMAGARFSEFLGSIGDRDANGVLASANNAFAYAVAPPLIDSGYPVGMTDNTGCDVSSQTESCSQGTSPVRGVRFAYLDSTNCSYPNGGAPCDNAKHHREFNSFENAILAEGLQEYYGAYVNAYGYDHWISFMGIADGSSSVNVRFDGQTILGFLYSLNSTDQEGFQDTPGVNTTLSTKGFNYINFIDYLDSTPYCTSGKDCSHLCPAVNGNPTCNIATTWFILPAVADVTGNTADLDGTSRQAAFDIEMQKLALVSGWTTPVNAAGNSSEWMSAPIEAGIDAAIANNPTNPNDYTTASTVPVLTQVPMTGTTYCVGPLSGTATCTITWNAPADLVKGPTDNMNQEYYQLRYWSCPTEGTDCPAEGKKIVGWLYFHPNCLTSSTSAECTEGTGNVANNPCNGGYNASDGSGCWEAASDPRTHANWFESVPVPDGLSNNTPLSSSSTSYTFTAAANTTYTFDLRAWETSGSTGGGGSTGSPTVSITSPAAGATVSGTTTLSADASSSTAIASVQFQVDGSILGSAITSSPYSMSWDTTMVSNGSHTITAVATDTASNTNSASETVTVDNSTSTSPPLPSPGNLGGATITANTQFIVDAQNLAGALNDCTGCQFQSSSDLIPGQTLEVRLVSGATTPTALAIVLHPGTLNGTVTSIGTNQFTLLPAPGSPAPSAVLVLTPPNVTVFEGFASSGATVQVGQTVAVRGLLFKSGPQAGPTLLAGKVVLAP
jgi:hypothetical protein